MYPIIQVLYEDCTSLSSLSFSFLRFCRKLVQYLNVLQYVENHMVLTIGEFDYEKVCIFFLRDPYIFDFPFNVKRSALDIFLRRALDMCIRVNVSHDRHGNTIVLSSTMKYETLCHSYFTLIFDIDDISGNLRTLMWVTNTGEPTGLHCEQSTCRIQCCTW